MPTIRSVTIALAAIVTVSALSFGASRAQDETGKPKPYKPVAIQLPQPVSDPTFVAFRKQLADIVKRKDRGTLAKQVASNFFWTTDDGDDATDKARSGADNMVRALYLDNPDTEGWDILMTFASDPTADPLPERNGVICAPGEPKYDTSATDLGDSTGTTSASWYYPVRDGIEVHSGPGKDSAVIGKLGMHLVWIYPDDSAAGAGNADTIRIAMPSGQLGYVTADSLMPLPGDLLCYAKDGNAWKLAGYIGGLAPAK